MHGLVNFKDALIYSAFIYIYIYFFFFFFKAQTRLINKEQVYVTHVFSLKVI